ncbi:probable aminoacyl tRNA synthase complex-interacting multifunctional protein 2 isoform X2 [Venturia canescens]|uniref:probable aminoacyl tRNA synthase complex-interacting multifunctional protein 2 isoform X2 n=1 Tax=Venturia canescens TaxID=32260 RepID=UPI001C9C658A|nr:probable aminoacyl tRNA synthase complex-interacting multifunctional protein 2 isoform X2 [Venturia canescens]
MNGETMYTLKPLIASNLMTTNKNNCMYEMKNIHEICSGDNHASKFCNNVTDIPEQNPLPEVAVLEARQGKILAQLAQLKETVLCLCNVLKFQKAQNPTVVNLIIKANPEKPCWTILGLHKIWLGVNFNIKSYRHSDTRGTIPEFTVRGKRAFHDTVNVTLIWKNVEDTEIILPGVHSYPLVGESNLLRYLERQLSTVNSEKLANKKEFSRTDNLLDLSYRLNYDSPKEMQSTLSELSEKLGNRNWFSTGERPGTVDVALWSAVKRTSLKKIHSGLTSWFERCENTFLK